jgi:presenilin-like A22 family membrane protease
MATMNEEETEKKSLSIFLCIGMAVLLVLTQVIAVLLAAPFEASDIKAFEDPESIWNTVYFIILIVGFTALILIVLKFGGDKLVHFIMLAAVAVTVYYVMVVLVPYGYIPAVVITLALTLLLYIYPEWYIINASGLIIGGGAAAIFGVSLDIIPVILLMIILAVYDAISVYKTKHMVSLAESIVDMRLPILFVLPRKRNFSLMKDSDREEAFFMGLGDAIIPSMLVVSAFMKYISAAPALGAAIGTLVGYAVLSRIAGRGKPHAGLPLLNSGAIIGFVIGLVSCQP